MGRVSSITITDSGNGLYTTAPTIKISLPDADSANATAVATIVDSSVSTIALTDSGYWYITAPTVTIGAPDSGGTQATATASIDSDTGGRVTLITITDSGSGYSSIPTITLDSADGTAADYRATATCTIDSNGFVNSITITDSGAGYDSAPTVQFLGGLAVDSDYRVGDSASQTLASGTKISGEIQSVILESDGDPYRYLMMAHVGGDDGKYHTFVTGTQLINSSRGVRNNGYEVISVSDSDNKIMETEQNEIFSTFSDDFLDFTEDNPFGDPENQ